MVDGQEHTHRHSREQDDGGLALVPEPELVRLGPPVHARQGTEDGVDDEVRAARRQEQEEWDRHAEGNPRRSQMVVAGGLKPVERAHLQEDPFHAHLLLLS